LGRGGGEAPVASGGAQPWRYLPTSRDLAEPSFCLRKPTTSESSAKPCVNEIGVNDAYIYTYICMYLYIYIYINI